MRLVSFIALGRRIRRNRARTTAAAFGLAAAIQTGPAFAIDKVYSPIVSEGESEVEYAGSTTFDSDRDKSDLQSHEVELEYGVSDRVMLELSGEFEKSPGEGVQFTGTGIGGHFQFFEQGENWLDSGLLVSYGHATRSSEPDELEVKLLLEKQTGPFLNRANIGIEQEVGGHAEGGPDRVFLWNSRYRLNVNFEPGFEIQSDFGKAGETDSFDKQEHYIGPAVFGEIVPHLKYEAAYYFGVSKAAAKSAARVLIEYERFF